MQSPTMRADRDRAAHPDGARPAEGTDRGDRFLRLVQAGDAVGACKLLLGLSGRLYGYLMQRYHAALGGSPGVEAVVLTAIWKAFERGDSYSPYRGSLEFWLWRIGVNEAQDELRKLRVRQEKEAAASQGRPRSTDPGREELGRAIRECIQRLPNPHHRAILLRDLEYGGLAPSKVLGEELGLQRQTILNLRRKAHTAIEPALQELMRHG